MSKRRPRKKNKVVRRKVEEEEEEKTKFSIMTFNINFGFTGSCESSRKIYKAVEEAQYPDILCFQETHDQFHRHMRKQWRKIYPYFVYHGPENYLAGGNEIMSKFPIKQVCYEYPTEEGERLEGCLFRQLVVEVNIKGETFLLLNLHLRPGVSLSNGVFSHIKSYLHDTDVIRLKEFRHFWNQMNETADWKNTRKLVVGDFNEGKWGRTCGFLKKRGYKDAAKNSTTWYWPLWGGLNAFGSYDHIYSHPDYFKLVKADVMKKYKLISDHIPVVAEFEILEMEEEEKKKKEEEEEEEEEEGEDIIDNSEEEEEEEEEEDDGDDDDDS